MHTKDDFIGAVKIKDGLFMGDEYAAGDFELLSANKITHVINCAGRELTNHWDSMGIAYLTLTWQETDYQVLFEGKFDVVTHVFRFIENAINKGESVLVHSNKGLNRCCCVIAVYCMKKYRWTLYKTLEFIQSRRPKMAIRPNFYSQLVNLENKMTRMGQGAKSFNWKEMSENPNNLESDELLITNTFLNSKVGPQADFNNFTLKEHKSSKLMWIDQQMTAGPKPFLATILSSKSNNKHKNKQIVIQENDGKEFVKSILKGSDKLFCVSDQEKARGNEKFSRKNSVGDTNSVFSANGQGRKATTKLRPGSANAPTKSMMTKSSSSPILEKVETETKIPKIQGNIFHVNVNNYMSNNERPHSSKGTNKNDSPYAEKKVALSMNSSNLEMMSKSSSLHNSVNYERNQRDPRNLFQKEDNALSLSSHSKMNEFSPESISTSNTSSSIGIFGSRTSKYDSFNEKEQVKVRKITQPIRAFKIDETRYASAGKPTAVYNPTTGLIKYLNNGKTTPMRTKESDLSLKSFNNFFEANKEPIRPVTAPINTTKKRQDSPYSHPDSAAYPNLDHFKDKNANQNPRSGSLQHKKEASKMIITKNKFKSTIPIPMEASYIPMVPKTRVIL